MDLMLNAVEDSESESSPRLPPPPPAFAMPVSRISARGGASLSSILSAASPQTPNDAPPFELPVARHGGYAGLANLMNSPYEADRDHTESPRDEAFVEVEVEVFGRGSDVVPLRDEPETAEEVIAPHVAVIERSQESDVEMRDAPLRDEDAEEEGEEEGEEGEEMEGDAMENDESPTKRPRGYSVASENSVSTPPPMATSVHSPASVAVNADALVLEDAELVELKAALQTAIQKYLTAEAKANAPPAKRRKGKQPQKKRGSQAAASADASTAVSESLEAVDAGIAKVHGKITMELTEIAVLRDVVRMCVVFLGIVNGVDPVHRAQSSHDLKTALKNLQRKPVHMQLASTIRRVMLSVPEDAVPLVLGDVLDWITSSDTEIATWGWLFVFFAQFDSSAVVDFFVHHIVFQQSAAAHGDQETQLVLVVLESLAPNRTSEIVDAVRRALQLVATGSVSSTTQVSDPLSRLISLGSRSSTLLQAVDDSFQWIFTRDLVLALWQKHAEDARPVRNGAGEQQGEVLAISSKLLQLIDERSVELDNTIFQLVLLLQQLSSASRSSPPSDMVRLAGKFHADVVRIAQHQADTTILRNVHRRIPYIAQTCIELLHQDQESTNTGLVTSRLESWRAWLVAIAESTSYRDVTHQLLQADLTACEVASSSDAKSGPVEAVCGLLCSVVKPSSQDFVLLLREITEWLRHLAVSSAGRYRLLSILEHLVKESTSSYASELKLIPLQLEGLGSDDVDSVIDAFSHMSTCQESWTQLEQWRAASGAELWEYLLDLVVGVGQDNSEISVHALFLLAKTPFPSLEDPLWQFRCIRKLTNVYFYTLRRYRASTIDLEVSQETRRECRKQLETMRSIIGRVCALDGAVAHYPSSVCSQFTSLWLDLLFSTASATSVPTHFPSSTKGDGITLKKRGSTTTGDRRDSLTAGEDHVVIRSERTISSKCTNLQSSQVITKHSDTLVYRKALDETWERELHAAFACSVLATNVLAQLVHVRSLDVDADKCERRIKVLVDMLLDRATPCCGSPSDDVYKEILPNRSSFDVDLRIEQWINHFPAFLPLLRLVIEHSISSPASTQSLRLVPIIKSALAVLVGHWNSVKGELDVENMDVPPYMRNRNQLALSCELLRIIRASGWLPEPLARTAELLPLTTPADVRGILFSCWFFLADHPPTATSPAPGSTKASAAPTKMPIEFYLLPVRKALHRNIHKVGAKYASFTC